MKKHFLAGILVLALCLMANTFKAQAVVGPPCGNPCSYKFVNNLNCPIKLRVMLTDGAGNFCWTNPAVGVPANTGVCLITAALFAACGTSWNVVITVYDIGGTPITSSPCNSIDHLGIFGNTTGFCADPSGCSPSGQYEITNVPGGGCSAQIDP
jgi:hypothetical protein